MDEVRYEGEAASPTAAERRDGVSLSAQFDVDPTPEGARACRALVRELLTQWAVEAVAANAAVDVAHELAANAVRHGQPPVTVTVQCTTTVVRVGVSDASPLPVRRLPYRSGVSERGLGMRLVSQLSREWGQRSQDEGKLVWATISRRARG